MSCPGACHNRADNGSQLSVPAAAAAAAAAAWDGPRLLTPEQPVSCRPGSPHQWGACSVINPLIAPMTLVYFIITGMTAKYSLLYIQRPAYASGGKVRHAAAPAFHCPAPLPAVLSNI